jgi:putative ABC transport system permease protein
MLNKLRSVLTLLGMMIGVGAVIAIVSLGEGLRNDFENQMQTLGSNVFFMAPKSPKRPGQAEKPMRLFDMDDMDAIEREAPSIESVVPAIDVGVTAKFRDEIASAHVLGVYEDYLEPPSTDKLITGRMFSMAERVGSARVVLIGKRTQEDLFEEWQDPVGEYVKLNGVNYLIIGRIERPAGTVSGAPDVNTGFLAPVTTVQKRIIGNEEVFWVNLYMKPGADMGTAKEEVAVVMRQRRGVRNVADDDFQFLSPDDFLEIGNQFINVMVGIFGAIAFLSLLVGGVGIMNIMLVSVTERTREIGLRMAMGAQRNTVLVQFLVEAVLLTLIGGLIGMLLGYGSAIGLSFILEQLLESRWVPVIPPLWVAYSLGVSMMVGVIFGVYPAIKASRLDPVEAMRFE